MAVSCDRLKGSRMNERGAGAALKGRVLGSAASGAPRARPRAACRSATRHSGSRTAAWCCPRPAGPPHPQEPCLLPPPHGFSCTSAMRPAHSSTCSWQAPRGGAHCLIRASPRSSSASLHAFAYCLPLGLLIVTSKLFTFSAPRREYRGGCSLVQAAGWVPWRKCRGAAPRLSHAAAAKHGRNMAERVSRWGKSRGGRPSVLFQPPGHTEAVAAGQPHARLEAQREERL